MELALNNLLFEQTKNGQHVAGFAVQPCCTNCQHRKIIDYKLETLVDTAVL